jgi:hypothetical protein
MNGLVRSQEEGSLIVTRVVDVNTIQRSAAVTTRPARPSQDSLGINYHEGREYKITRTDFIVF